MRLYPENKVFWQLNFNKMQMKTQNLLGFFFVIASLFLLVSTVSATSEIANVDLVEINGIEELGNQDISVIAGETLDIKVYFTSLVDASDVKIEAELEGDKVSLDTETFLGDLEAGQRYTPTTLSLRVPYELKDQVSEYAYLYLKIWNGDYRTDYTEIALKVQRPSYNVDVMAISTSQTVEAGEVFPVDVVMKNTGYNYLDDLYLTVKIATLGIEKTVYIGDLVEVEDDDEEDTVSARVYLRVPYEAQSGIYNLEIEVANDDMIVSEMKQIVVDNDFSSNVIVTSYSKTFAAGENGAYSLLLVNPTNQLVVYRIVTESSGALSTSASDGVIAVPAGSSKTVNVMARAATTGDYTFDVHVFSGEELLDTVTLTANVEGGSASSAIVVLTIILAIIFIVLLVILIVLLRKRPEKSEEFGESYY